MTVVTARPEHAARAGGVRRLVLGGLLVAAVVVGLVAMHTLNLHGTAAAQVPAAAQTHASHADDASAVHEPVVASTDASGACEHCVAAGHLGMAMSCVLALLALLLVLVPPRLLPRWFHESVPTGRLRLDPVSTALPVAPSLHVLCISRT
ncbi:DUF6153 family protein [Aeromicrobium sp.]|uniref:DUF6153 family protein n=1 Tax=Aeromicrobium sp. TaxID=1871063 RepID=UPI0028AC0262|nr:DUF6153 family protein [Aeromicrobium sp.]